MIQYSVTLTRSGDLNVDGWNVYGKANGYPLEDGDGTFIQYVPIDRWDDTATLYWYAPNSLPWYFAATAIYAGVPGKFERCT